MYAIAVPSEEIRDLPHHLVPDALVEELERPRRFKGVWTRRTLIYADACESETQQVDVALTSSGRANLCVLFLESAVKVRGESFQLIDAQFCQLVNVGLCQPKHPFK